MGEKEEIMAFLHKRVFDPVLNSEAVSSSVKRRVRFSAARMKTYTLSGIVSFYIKAMTSSKGKSLALEMQLENFSTFETVAPEFLRLFKLYIAPKQRGEIQQVIDSLVYS